MPSALGVVAMANADYEGGPILELIEMLSLAQNPRSGEVGTDRGGGARRLAELISADFAMQDESRRPVFLASLTDYLAEGFGAEDLESLASFFETELGRSWRENKKTLDQSLLLDTSVLGCALAVVAPNPKNALSGRPQLSEVDQAKVLAEASPFLAAVRTDVTDVRIRRPRTQRSEIIHSVVIGGSTLKWSVDDMQYCTFDPLGQPARGGGDVSAISGVASYCS